MNRMKRMMQVRDDGETKDDGGGRESTRTLASFASILGLTLRALVVTDGSASQPYCYGVLTELIFERLGNPMFTYNAMIFARGVIPDAEKAGIMSFRAGKPVLNIKKTIGLLDGRGWSNNANESNTQPETAVPYFKGGTVLYFICDGKLANYVKFAKALRDSGVCYKYIVLIQFAHTDKEAAALTLLPLAGIAIKAIGIYTVPLYHLYKEYDGKYGVFSKKTFCYNKDNDFINDTGLLWKAVVKFGVFKKIDCNGAGGAGGAGDDDKMTGWSGVVNFQREIERNARATTVGTLGGFPLSFEQRFADMPPLEYLCAGDDVIGSRERRKEFEVYQERVTAYREKDQESNDQLARAFQGYKDSPESERYHTRAKLREMMLLGADSGPSLRHVLPPFSEYPWDMLGSEAAAIQLLKTGLVNASRKVSARKQKALNERDMRVQAREAAAGVSWTDFAQASDAERELAALSGQEADPVVCFAMQALHGVGYEFSETERASAERHGFPLPPLGESGDFPYLHDGAVCTTIPNLDAFDKLMRQPNGTVELGVRLKLIRWFQNGIKNLSPNCNSNNAVFMETLRLATMAKTMGDAETSTLAKMAYKYIRHLTGFVVTKEEVSPTQKEGDVYNYIMTTETKMHAFSGLRPSVAAALAMTIELEGEPIDNPTDLACTLFRAMLFNITEPFSELRLTVTSSCKKSDENKALIAPTREAIDTKTRTIAAAELVIIEKTKAIADTVDAVDGESKGDGVVARKEWPVFTWSHPQSPVPKINLLSDAYLADFIEKHLTVSHVSPSFIGGSDKCTFKQLHAAANNIYHLLRDRPRRSRSDVPFGNARDSFIARLERVLSTNLRTKIPLTPLERKIAQYEHEIQLKTSQIRSEEKAISTLEISLRAYEKAHADADNQIKVCSEHPIAQKYIDTLDEIRVATLDKLVCLSNLELGDVIVPNLPEGVRAMLPNTILAYFLGSFSDAAQERLLEKMREMLLTFGDVSWKDYGDLNRHISVEARKEFIACISEEIKNRENPGCLQGN